MFKLAFSRHLWRILSATLVVTIAVAPFVAASGKGKLLAAVEADGETTSCDAEEDSDFAKHGFYVGRDIAIDVKGRCCLDRTFDVPTELETDFLVGELKRGPPL